MSKPFVLSQRKWLHRGVSNMLSPTANKDVKLENSFDVTRSHIKRNFEVGVSFMCSSKGIFVVKYRDLENFIFFS